MRSNNKRKCYYYKCDVTSFDEEVRNGNVTLFTMPSNKYE